MNGTELRVISLCSSTSKLSMKDGGQGNPQYTLFLLRISVLPGVKSFLQKGISACGHVQSKIKSLLFCSLEESSDVSFVQSKSGKHVSTDAPRKMQTGEKKVQRDYQGCALNTFHLTDVRERTEKKTRQVKDKITSRCSSCPDEARSLLPLQHNISASQSSLGSKRGSQTITVCLKSCPSYRHLFSSNQRQPILAQPSNQLAVLPAGLQAHGRLNNK